jgi:hypothetical protein
MKAKTPVGLLAAMLGTFCYSNLAVATPITYNWAGTVTHIDPGAPTGVLLDQTIEISLTLDNAISDENPSPDVGNYSADPATSPLVLSVDIGGDTYVGPFQTLTVSDGSSGASIEISSSEEMTGEGFDILFQTDQPGVLDSDAIPLYIDPENFKVATFSVDRETAFTEFLPAFEGTIGAAESVPEPFTLSIFGAGVIGAVAMRRRKKA